jgi:hypothetical protein
MRRVRPAAIGRPWQCQAIALILERTEGKVRDSLEIAGSSPIIISWKEADHDD